MALPPHTNQGQYVPATMLPPSKDTYFKDTAFFTSGNASLPTPADVRQAAIPNVISNRPVPVVFSALNLIVKYGPELTVAEGQFLWALRHFLPSVSVPEIYGWCRDQGETFLYMQLVEGIILERAWPDFDVKGKFDICQKLHRILENLRQLKQDPSLTPFIRDINQGPLRDVMFQTSGQLGHLQTFQPLMIGWLKLGVLLLKVRV